MRLSTVFCASLLFLLLPACGGGGDDGGGPGGPGGGPGGPGGGPGGPGGPEGGPPEGGAQMVAPGTEIPVTLDLTVKSRKKGTVSFLGVKKSKVEGTWIQGGQRPDFFWTSPEIDLSGSTARLNAPLPEGLTYFAVVNQTSDPLPGDGDLTSGPSHYDRGGSLSIAIDGKFGETRIQPGGAGGDGGPGGGPGGPGGPGGGPDGGAGAGRAIDQDFPPRPITLDLPADQRPEGPITVLVIGRKPASAGADTDAPDYFWRSEDVTPKAWPHAMDVPLPEGMAARVMVDADGDRMPSVGDPTTPLDDAFASAPKGTPVEFVLDEVFSTSDVPARGFEEPDADEGDGGPQDGPTAAGGEPRTLTLSTEVRLPFIRTGRFMVVGLAPAEPFAWPPRAKTEFLWVSQPTKLNWPVTLEAQVPDGLDLLVVLDLDGSGFPDTGDLSSKPVAKYKRPAKGAEVAIELAEVIPVPEGD